MVTGTITKGIIIIGLSTIGTPNVTGSLMLNIAGPNAILPTVRNWVERERSI